MKKEDVKKVTVIDFDGTLIDTTLPEIGKKIWKEKTGNEYPHRGWWSRRESLDIDIYPNEVFSDIEIEYNKAKSESNTFVSLCTGRITPLTKQVKVILNKYNFKFDDVVLTGDKRFNNGASDTLSFKINYLNSLQKEFPNLEEIEFFDDRTHHNATFVNWGDKQKILVTINHVKRTENNH
jgi:hypothetical protein